MNVADYMILGINGFLVSLGFLLAAVVFLGGLTAVAAIIRLIFFRKENGDGETDK